MRVGSVVSLSVLLAACSSEPTNGLPEGTSTWSGTGEASGITFLLDVEMVNDGGDLSGTVTVTESPEFPVGIGTGIYSISGTHEPVSGSVAIAPDSWIQETSIETELLGFIGAYNPETNELSGSLADYATGDDNAVRGGPATLAWTAGEGEPTEVGDEAQALAADETLAFSGTFTCTTSEREVIAELDYDGIGGVSGTVRFGNLGLDADPHAFAVSGVHNPSTGGLTLVPGTYSQPGEESFLTFFLDGTFDAASGSFVADGRTNQGPCPTADSWDSAL